MVDLIHVRTTADLRSPNVIVLLRSFKNIFLVTELRKKILFTLGVFLVYRLGTHIPIPGVNTHAFSKLLGSGVAGGLLSYLDLFAGGALKRFAIFALGMGPYINASIMMQLLTVMLPSLTSNPIHSKSYCKSSIFISFPTSFSKRSNFNVNEGILI